MDVCSGPFNGKYGRFEEFFVCVFLADILLMEIVLGQLVDKESMSWKKVFFGESRIEHECLVLKA